VTLDVFSQSLESKADKQMVVNATINKVSRVDLENLLKSKCERASLDQGLQALQVRIDEEVATLTAAVSRKATQEDIAYVRKETAGKLERAELEAFRQEFVERVTRFDQKMLERNQIMQQFGEALEHKVDLQIGEIKHQLHIEIDKRVEATEYHEMKAEMRAQFERVLSEVNANKFEAQKKHENVISGIIRTNEENSDKFGHLSLKLTGCQEIATKLQDSHAYLLQERKADLLEISELLKASA
jgi:hypothetical protein